MPKQETFFEREIDGHRIEIVKSYDQGYAREAFNGMADDGMRHLWTALKPEEIYDPIGLPAFSGSADVNGEAESFLWDEMLEQAREDGNTLSFFIVNETHGGRSENLYVAPDWPSAEGFAVDRLASLGPR